MQQLKLTYYHKPNTGQGFSRNYGFERAKGDYFVVFDSDCLIPPHYFQAVEAHLNTKPLDAFGGPDRAHKSFTTVQKAISYSMTSPFTTGGIRGNKNHVGTFHPRSFNMGISRDVYEKTGGYKITRMGEDIEFSIRIIEHGFKTGLIEDAYVYHKRRTSLDEFYKQLHFFGRARINVGRFFPKEIKPVHLLPAGFTLGVWSLLPLYLFIPNLFQLGMTFIVLYYFGLFIHALLTTNSLAVAFVSLPAAFIQLYAYGVGFLTEGLKRIFKG